MLSLPNKEWLTAKEVAGILGLTILHLHRFRKRGDGPPFYHMGGRFYYQREEFREWLSRSRGP